MIPADILDIAAVVTGEQQLPLTGWQRDHAIAAMAALGHSSTHIAAQLCIGIGTLRNRASHIGVRLNGADRRPDWTAIDMVATGTACIRLRGVDQVEAIRLMAAAGLDSRRQARRLCTDTTTVLTVADRHGIPVPRMLAVAA